MGRDGDTPLARLAQAIVAEDGFAFAAPFVSDDGSTAIVPIVRKTAPVRGYVLAAEVKDAVSATDRGRLDRLRVANETATPVVLLPGTLFASEDTASRATTVGVVLAPGTETDVEVKCVHASRDLTSGAELTIIPTLAPARVTRSLLSRDQGLVWAVVADRGAGQQGPPSVASDDLVADMRSPGHPAARPGGGHGAIAEGQCGIVVLNSDGVAAVEWLDHPESWAAASAAIRARHEPFSHPVDKSSWTRSLDPEGAVRAAKEFIGRLGKATADRAGPGSWVAHDPAFEYTVHDGRVIHLIAFGGRDPETTVPIRTFVGASVDVPSSARSPDATAGASSEDGEVAVASIPVSDEDTESGLREPRPRRRKVLTSGWDGTTFAVLDHYARKEFRGDRSAAMRFLVRQGLRRQGYFGPLPSPAEPVGATSAPDPMVPSAELSRASAEARLHDLERIAEMPEYAGWLRKRARIEMERMASSLDDESVRAAAQSAIGRLSPIEPDLEPVPEAIEPSAPVPVAPAPPPPAPVDVRPLLRAAFEASAAANYRQAVSLFSQALDADPENRTARLGRALAHRRSGKSPEALVDLDDVLRVEPRNAAALLARGRILQERGDLPDALGVFDLLVDAAPNDWDVWMAQGDVLAKMNRTEDALRSYREALRRNPDNADLGNRVRVLEGSHPAAAPRTLPRPTLPRELEEGQSYLVREARHERSQALFRAVAALKVPSLVLTSRSRDLVRKELGVAGARILSLSFTPGEDHYNPTALASLTRTIERFVEDNQGHGVILLDGLDELVTNNGFRDTILSIERVHETILQSRAIFLISIGPGELGEKQVALLERSLRVIG